MYVIMYNEDVRVDPSRRWQVAVWDDAVYNFSTLTQAVVFCAILDGGS